MNTMKDSQLLDALQGLKHGDFSRLEPLLTPDYTPAAKSCRIIEWYEQGAFANEPQALAEAFTCACFLGRTGIAEFLLDSGVNPLAGTGTGLSGFTVRRTEDSWRPSNYSFALFASAGSSESGIPSLLTPYVDSYTSRHLAKRRHPDRGANHETQVSFLHDGADFTGD